MRTLVKRMSSLKLLKVQIVIGTIIMALALVGLPVSILFIDPALFAEPMMLIVIGCGMLFFGLAGFLCFVRPYLLFRKTPEILVETDDEFLYIHGNKEAKIRLSEIEYVNIYPNLPFIFSGEFISEMIIHACSEKYGDIELDIDGFGSYKLRFVSQVERTTDELLAYIQAAMDRS